MKPKFKIGDKVKVIKYGSLMHDHKGTHEVQPEIIGKEGIISQVASAIEFGKRIDPVTYAIEGIPGKKAWYYEDQLELINANPNEI